MRRATRTRPTGSREPVAQASHPPAKRKRLRRRGDVERRPALLEDLADARDEAVHVERLREVVDGAGFDARALVLGALARRDEDDRDVVEGGVLLDRAAQ